MRVSSSWTPLRAEVANGCSFARLNTKSPKSKRPIACGSSSGQVQRHHRESTIDIRNLMGNAFRHHDRVALAYLFGHPALNRTAGQIRLVRALFLNQLAAGDHRARTLDDIKQLRLVLVNAVHLGVRAPTRFMRAWTAAC